jgi:hypothetical protein
LVLYKNVKVTMIRFYPIPQLFEANAPLREAFNFLSDSRRLAKMCACISYALNHNNYIDIWQNSPVDTLHADQLPDLKRLFNDAVTKFSYRSVKSLGRLTLTRAPYFYEVVIRGLGEGVSRFFYPSPTPAIFVKEAKRDSWYQALAEGKEPNDRDLDFEDIILRPLSGKANDICPPLPIPFEVRIRKRYAIKVSTPASSPQARDTIMAGATCRVRLYPFGVASAHLTIHLHSLGLTKDDLTKLTRSPGNVSIQDDSGAWTTPNEFLNCLTQRLFAGIFAPGVAQAGQIRPGDSYTLIEFIEEAPPLNPNDPLLKKELFTFSSSMPPERLEDKYIEQKIGSNLSRVKDSFLFITANTMLFKHKSKTKHYLRKILRDVVDYTLSRRVATTLLLPRVSNISNVYVSSGVAPKDRIRNLRKISLVQDARPLLLTRFILQKADRRGSGFKGYLGSIFEERIGLGQSRQDLEKEFNNALQSLGQFKPTASTVMDLIGFFKQFV